MFYEPGRASDCSTPPPVRRHAESLPPASHLCSARPCSWRSRRPARGRHHTCPARSSSATAARTPRRPAPCPRTRVLHVKDVAGSERSLRKRPDVLSVTPNYIAHSSGWVPPDPGQLRRRGRLAEPAMELHAGHGRQRAGRLGAPRAGRPPGRQGRHGRGAGHRDRLCRPRSLPPLARSREEALRPRLGLRRQRPLSQRRQRPRHARRQHDRRGHRQHDRPHRPRLRRQADAGQGARPHRRGRLVADRQRHPLRRRPRREGHQPLVRVPVGDHAATTSRTSSTRSVTPARSARSSSAPPATPRPPPSPTRPARATSSPSAPPPSTAARPTTPTRAPTSTSSPPAAAPTPPWTTTPTATRKTPRAWTSSR